MKRILTILSVIAIFMSCSKPNTIDNPYGVTENKDAFFKISFGGKTLTSTGVKFSNQLYSAWVFNYLWAGINTSTYNGVVKSSLTIFVEPMYASVFGNYGLKDGQVGAFIDVSRIGNAIGTYTEFEWYQPHSINDYTVGNKEYEIETGSLSINVTTADISYIKGTFSCKLIDGTNKISASGSFSLPKS